MTKKQLKDFIKQCLKESVAESSNIIIPNGKTSAGNEASKVLQNLIYNTNIPPVYWEKVKLHATELIKLIDDSQNPMIK
jgi:hypothetical protein